MVKKIEIKRFGSTPPHSQLLKRHDAQNSMLSKNDIDAINSMLKQQNEIDTIKPAKILQIINMLKLAYNNPDSLKSLIMNISSVEIQVAFKMKVN